MPLCETHTYARSLIKIYATRILGLWFPLVLVAALPVHVWFKPLTWELVAYYGILAIVAFVGSGIQIHLKCKDIEALVGEWRSGADVTLSADKGERHE